MKGEHTIIGEFEDGNTNVMTVEWQQHDQRDYELLLFVDGDVMSIRTTDIPRVMRLMSQGLDCVVERLEELVKEELSLA